MSGCSQRHARRCLARPRIAEPPRPCPAHQEARARDPAAPQIRPVMSFLRALQTVSLAAVLFLGRAAAGTTCALADQTPADRENARALWQDGLAKRARNDHPGALKSFEAADALMAL